MKPLLLALVLGVSACGEAPPPPEPAPTTFVLVTIDGRSLHEQLVAHAASAREAGQAPFVQLYGDWCASCRALRGSMEHPQMKDAFAGTYVVQIDTAVWHQELVNGFWVPERYAVPTFFELRNDGSFGARVDGNAWEGDLPDRMAPVLRTFFRGHGASGT